MKSVVLLFLLSGLAPLWPLPAGAESPAIADWGPPAAGGALITVPVPAALSGPSLWSARMERQEAHERATLEVRQPDVQWSLAGTARWVSIPDREQVVAGDRLRTGPGASARLVYYEGTTVEVRAETGLLVQRLERSSEGDLVTRLFVTIGGIVSNVIPGGFADGGFQVETPAAIGTARGTRPRVEVTADGTTILANLPDASGGTVAVQGKDPAGTAVVVAAGLQTRVRPGEAPLEPYPIQPGLRIRYCQGTLVCPP